MKIYDLIIVGAGPAGITAGIYSARKKIDFIIITKDIGGQASLSLDIQNYIGYQFITGPELVEKFIQHIKEFDVKIEENKEVQKIFKDGKIFRIVSSDSEYISKIVIIATGRKPKKLNVKGEEEFKNKGITYCATCDAPLFKDKIVAVIGGGNAGFDAALQLTKIAKKIYLIEKKREFSADKIVIEKVLQSGKTETFKNTEIKEILGDKFVKGIKILKEGKKEEIIEVEGVFVEIGSISNSDIIDFVEKNRDGEIIVDCKNLTSYPGIFAAGDVTNVFAKQIIVACGEGAKASISAFEYLKYI